MVDTDKVRAVANSFGTEVARQLYRPQSERILGDMFAVWYAEVAWRLALAADEIDALRDRLRAAEERADELKAGGWIPTSDRERLPPFGQRVFVWWPEESCNEPVIATRYRVDDPYWPTMSGEYFAIKRTGESVTYDQATHWMPFPAPPEAP
jgi:hypothetical protein